MQNNVGLPGMVQLPKRFQVVRRRNKRNYINDSLNEGVETTEVAATTEIASRAKEKRSKAETID
jgi:hypothetical protein